MPLNGANRSRVVVLLAAARILFGVGLLTAPGAMTRAMWGAPSAAAPTRMYARSGGARDIVLGIAAAAAPSRRDVLWMSAACDAADTVVTALDHRDVPRSRWLPVTSLACAAALANIVLARA